MATRICPQCGTESQAPFCRADGFATVDSARYLARDLHSREGDTLAARYRLDQLIGRSALGSTYRATDLRLGVAVAVRLLAPWLATDLGLIARFQREGRLVASLAHPNIVHVMEHGVAEDGTLFIAQELVAGPTLAEALTRSGPFDPLRVVALGHEIFDALSEAHAHGVLHRSLGLDNVVLVTRPGGGESVKIGDFGLVQVLADDNATPFTYPQVLSGAWRAMAPEQARGKGVSGHADLYSVGCILYELVTGRPVFGDGSPSDLLVAHSVKMPPPLDREGRLLAGPLVELVMRCLEKKPWNRPDGAQKALDQLELSRTQPVLPLPNPTAEFAAPPVGATGQRVKPRTNPYGHAVPATLTTTRPTLHPIEPTNMPTDPKGVPRPMAVKPQRLRNSPTAPEVSPAPRATAEVTTLSRSLAPGASAARAESSDRGFASRADLNPTGRAPGDPDFARRSRSPLLWFIAGMVAAGLVAFAIIWLSRDDRQAEPQSGVAHIATSQGANPVAPVAAPPEPPPERAAITPEVIAAADTTTIASDATTMAATEAGPSDAEATSMAIAEPVAATATAPMVAAADVEVVDALVVETVAVARTVEVSQPLEVAPAAVAPVPATRDDAPARLNGKVAGKEPNRTPAVDPKKPRDKNGRPIDPLADLEDPDIVAPKVVDATLQKVLIDSDPIGAKIAVGGRVVGETPMYVEWHGDGVDVVVTKVGYRPVRQRLGSGTGRAVRFALVPSN